ncbi:MAG: hypothetical protein J0L93_05275 [Deltaproteobacteria bacterium]|nr:hypothetical protein [Deltaproteobacteria bacterium]
MKMKTWIFSSVAALCLLTGLPQAFVLAQTTSVESEASSTLVISKDMSIPAGQNFESVVVLKGNVDIHGKVENLIVVSGRVHLFAGSEIADQLIVLQGSVQQDDGAIVPLNAPTKRTWSEKWRDLKGKFGREIDSGWLSFDGFQDRTDKFFEQFAGLFWIPLAIALPLACLIVLFGIALIFLFIAPRISLFADESFQKHPLASLIWGMCAYILFVPILGLMAISLIGIPLIPIFVLFAVLILFAGFFSVCRSLGMIALKDRVQNKSVLSTLIGIVIIFLISFIPFFGRSLIFLIMVAGTGAMLRSLIHKESVERPSYFED